LTLGKNASPKTMEEFDEQRGFNKPLLLGRWSGTRAFPDTDFRRNAGSWRKALAITHVPPADRAPGHIVLPAGTNGAVPLLFGLRPQTTYEWRLTYRLDRGSATLRVGEHALTLPASPQWKEATLRMTSGSETKPPATLLRSDAAPLQLRSMTLRRQNAHALDSQFVFYLRQIARLDFGTSNFTNQRVSQMLKDGLGPSLSLTIPIFVVELIVAVSIALLCAFFRDTWLDRSIVVVTVILMSVNYLVWIIAGQYVLGHRLGWFPLWGFESWIYLLLPVTIGVVSGLGENVRFYRTIMLDEMYRDYVRTAFAKGVGSGGVLFKHVLKNAMIPILTSVIIAIPFLYTGSLLLEGFFGIPGLGNMSINAINYSDVDVVRAVVLIGAVLYVIANLFTDLCYAWVDPRVRLS